MEIKRNGSKKRYSLISGSEEIYLGRPKESKKIQISFIRNFVQNYRRHDIKILISGADCGNNKTKHIYSCHIQGNTKEPV